MQLKPLRDGFYLLDEEQIILAKISITKNGIEIFSDRSPNVNLVVKFDGEETALPLTTINIGFS